MKKISSVVLLLAFVLMMTSNTYALDHDDPHSPTIAKPPAYMLINN